MPNPLDGMTPDEEAEAGRIIRSRAGYVPGTRTTREHYEDRPRCSYRRHGEQRSSEAGRDRLLRRFVLEGGQKSAPGVVAGLRRWLQGRWAWSCVWGSPDDISLSSRAHLAELAREHLHLADLL